MSVNPKFRNNLKAGIYRIKPLLSEGLKLLERGDK